MAKALLIKSTAGIKENVQGAWHLFDQATPYIQGIETGDLAENLTADVLNSMISGLPNIWSRARVFAYAFKYTRKDANITTSGLIKFYEALVNEWKGLLALLAIYPDRISISQPISLANDPANLFDISSAFGNMLFEDSDLWCNPDDLKITKKEDPFIQLIYYKNVLVGATSPYSLLFTGMDYSSFPDSSDVSWYRNGKLSDPIEFGNLNNDQLQKLFLLVSTITAKLPAFEQKLQTNRQGKENVSLSPVYVFVQSWLQEIKQKGYALVTEGVLDAELVFANPYKPLFGIKQDLYLNNGMFSFNAQHGGMVVDLQKILLQDEFIFTFTQVDEYQPLSESAVHYLTALDPNEAGKVWVQSC